MRKLVRFPGLRGVLVALMFAALVSRGETVGAQTAAQLPPDGCPVAPAADLPFAATAGARQLSSGGVLVTHGDADRTIVLHLPLHGAAIPPVPATALDDGDRVTSAPSADGTGIDLTWTLADAAAPLRRLALAIPGAPTTIRALDLRGLPACVRRQQAGDVVDLPLPAHLGTLHLTLNADGTSLAASTDGTDRLVASGSIALPALTAQVHLQGRFDPADPKHLIPLGDLAVVDDGLALQPAASIGQVLDAGGLPIVLQQFQLRLSRAASTASAAFTPVVSSSLPFSISTLSSRVDVVADRLVLACDGPAPLSFAAADATVGSGPFAGLRLAVDSTSPARLTCDGTRYTGFETVIALGWDNVIAGGPLKFQLAATPAGTSLTPLSGAVLPNLDVGSNPLGLRLHLTGGQLQIGPAASGGQLRLAGQVALELASAGIATAPTTLAVALRSSAGQLAAKLDCEPRDQAASHAGPQGPFALPVALQCANHEVVGLASAGGTVTLPAQLGGVGVKLPPFSFSLADRRLAPADLPIGITSAGSGSVFEFPGGHFDGLRLAYSDEAGLRAVGSVSVTLPTGQATAQALTFRDVAIGRRGSGLGVLAIGHVEAPNVAFAGMRLDALSDDGACKGATSPIDAQFDQSSQRVSLKLCAQAAFLPSFLAPMQTQSHVGDLGSGGGVVPPGPARASLRFHGLVIGHDGAPVDDGSPGVTTCPGDTTGELGQPERGLIQDEQREYLDCRVEAQLEPNFALGPLDLRQIRINLVRRLSDQTTVPSRPQFRILALVKFGKYLSTDGGTAGVINAQFNDQRMVVVGRFADVVSVRFGAASAGIRGFSMDFSQQQRSFVAEGGQLSAGNAGGVSSTTLYFSEIAFVEVRDKQGNFKIARLHAPIDVKRTGLGLLFRLVTDLGSTSFLHLFKLP